MPRPRFTVRWLMLGVAVVAACLGWIVERHDRFRRLSAAHMSRAIDASGPDLHHIASRIPSPVEAWHMELAAKYERACHRPWLPIATDAPKPD